MSFWNRKRKKTPVKADVNDEAVTVSDVTAEDPGQTDTVDWQARYTAEHEAFEKYRNEAANADRRRKREEAYRDLLNECGIPEKYRDRLTGLCDLGSLVIGDDGKIAGAEEIASSVREEWSELIPPPSVPVANPPMYRGQAMTKERIMAIKDRDARRAAILENFELFG